MPKIGGWKKIEGTGEITYRCGKHWINVDENKGLTPYQTKYKFWSVESNLEKHIWEDFKTKAQALKFARSLMRKHPEG